MMERAAVAFLRAVARWIDRADAEQSAAIAWMLECLENQSERITQWELRAEVQALWHFGACPFDTCERCIADEAIIKRIRDRLGPRT